MLRIWVALAVGLGLLVATTAAALAQEPVSNLRVVDASGGAVQATGGDYSFPAGTKKVIVQMDYNLASPQRLGVDVVALGVRALSLGGSFSGRSTASFDLTGEAIYGGVANRAASSAGEAISNVDNALKATVGVDTYLDFAEASVTDMARAVPVLQGLTLDDAYAQQMAALASATTTATAQVQAASTAVGVDAQKAKAGELKPTLVTAQQAAKAVADRLARATDVALPTTGSDGRTPIDVTVRLAGSPAGSLAILVGTGSLVPNVTATRPPATVASGSTPEGAPGGSAPTARPGTAAPTSSRSGGVAATAPAAGGSGGPGAARSTPLAGAGMAGSGALAVASTALPGAAAVAGAPAVTSVAQSSGLDAGAPHGGVAQSQPTWTVTADERNRLAQAPQATGNAPGAGGATGGGPGINLAVVALGAAFLAAAAVWLRRRM